MALTRAQKAEAIEEIEALLEQSAIVYLTDFAGLNVEQATDLRQRFREKGVDYKVVKNTLLKLAMDRVGGFEDLYDHLSGPTAVAFTSDPAAPARVIKNFVDDTKQTSPELKAAFVDGAIYDAGALDVLAALKSKEELIGDILGLLQAPLASVVGGLQSAGTNIASLVQALASREEAEA